jgi:hypothetical protein
MSKPYFIVPNYQIPAWRIFHERFGIRIQRLHLITKTELNELGVYCNKEQGYENYLNDMVDVMLTLDELAVLFEDGASFTVTNPTNTVEMYKLLLEHLEEAGAAWRNTMLAIRPPKADLKLFDNLAGALYKLATQYEVNEVLDGGMSAYMHSLSGRMRTARVSLNVVPEAAPVPERDYTYRSPVQSVLTQKPINGGRQWQTSNKP